jgi:hypothetical protein
MLKRVLLTSLAGLALCAPGVHANSEWSLVYTGTGSIDLAWHSDGAGSGNTTDHEEWADFSFRTEMTGIVFDDEGRLVSGGTGTSTPAGKGWKKTVYVTNGNTTSYACQYGGAAVTWPDYVPKLYADGGDLLVRPFDWLGIQMPCEGRSLPHTIKWPLHSNYTQATHPWAARFSMPREALALGKVINLVKSSDAAETQQCNIPNYYKTCDVTWSGEVTLTRTKYAPPAPAPGDDGAPLPPPLPEAPAHIEPPPLVPPAAPRPAPKPVAAPKVAPAAVSATSASTVVTCAAGCTGTVKAFAVGGGGAPRAAAAAKALASKRFTAPAGRATRVALRLSPRARRAVRRAGGVRLVVTTTPAGGGAPVSRTVAARLR